MQKNIFILSNTIAPSGINTVSSAKEKINFYPNPLSDLSTRTIQYELVNSQNNLFKIYNMDGQEVIVKKITPSQTYIELGSQKLSSGMYFYRLKSDDKVIAQGRIIVE